MLLVTVHLVVRARARKSRGFEGSGAGNSRGKACRRSSVVPEVALLSLLVLLRVLGGGPGGKRALMGPETRRKYDEISHPVFCELILPCPGVVPCEFELPTVPQEPGNRENILANFSPSKSTSSG